MRKHDFIVFTLVKIGFRTSLKGFEQFCMCVELFAEDRSVTIESIYERVAVEYNCTKSSVEKNLRRLFDSSDASRAMCELFCISGIDASNKEIIALFCNYIMLHEDEYICA